MRIDQLIEPCFCGLIHTCAIDCAFDQKSRLATIELQQL
jgi:hypothetical protein